MKRSFKKLSYLDKDQRFYGDDNIIIDNGNGKVLLPSTRNKDDKTSEEPLMTTAYQFIKKGHDSTGAAAIAVTTEGVHTNHFVHNTLILAIKDNVSTVGLLGRYNDSYSESVKTKIKAMIDILKTLITTTKIQSIAEYDEAGPLPVEPQPQPEPAPYRDPLMYHQNLGENSPEMEAYFERYYEQQYPEGPAREQYRLSKLQQKEKIKKLAEDLQRFNNPILSNINWDPAGPASGSNDGESYKKMKIAADVSKSIHLRKNELKKSLDNPDGSAKAQEILQTIVSEEKKLKDINMEIENEQIKPATTTIPTEETKANDVIQGMEVLKDIINDLKSKTTTSIMNNEKIDSLTDPLQNNITAAEMVKLKIRMLDLKRKLDRIQILSLNSINHSGASVEAYELITNGMVAANANFTNFENHLNLIAIIRDGLDRITNTLVNDLTVRTVEKVRVGKEAANLNARYVRLREEIKVWNNRIASNDSKLPKLNLFVASAEAMVGLVAAAQAAYRLMEVAQVIKLVGDIATYGALAAKPAAAAAAIPFGGAALGVGLGVASIGIAYDVVKELKKGYDDRMARKEGKPNPNDFPPDGDSNRIKEHIDRAKAYFANDEIGEKFAKIRMETQKAWDALPKIELNEALSNLGNVYQGLQVLSDQVYEANNEYAKIITGSDSEEEKELRQTKNSVNQLISFVWDRYQQFEIAGNEASKKFAILNDFVGPKGSRFIATKLATAFFPSVNVDAVFTSLKLLNKVFGFTSWVNMESDDKKVTLQLAPVMEKLREGPLDFINMDTLSRILSINYKALIMSVGSQTMYNSSLNLDAIIQIYESLLKSGNIPATTATNDEKTFASMWFIDTLRITRDTWKTFGVFFDYSNLTDKMNLKEIFNWWNQSHNGLYMDLKSLTNMVVGADGSTSGTGAELDWTTDGKASLKESCIQKVKENFFKSAKFIVSERGKKLFQAFNTKDDANNIDSLKQLFT